MDIKTFEVLYEDWRWWVMSEYTPQKILNETLIIEKECMLKIF